MSAEHEPKPQIATTTSYWIRDGKWTSDPPTDREKEWSFGKESIHDSIRLHDNAVRADITKERLDAANSCEHLLDVTSMHLPPTDSRSGVDEQAKAHILEASGSRHPYIDYQSGPLARQPENSLAPESGQIPCSPSDNLAHDPSHSRVR